jgi:hypothetical protein
MQIPPSRLPVHTLKSQHAPCWEACRWGPMRQALLGCLLLQSPVKGGWACGAFSIDPFDDYINNNVVHGGLSQGEEEEPLLLPHYGIVTIWWEVEHGRNFVVLWQNSTLVGRKVYMTILKAIMQKAMALTSEIKMVSNIYIVI